MTEETVPAVAPGLRLWTASRTARRLLTAGRPFTLAERMTELASSRYAVDEPTDVYGDGLIETLESRVARLLGKPSALWFPTGTMAQQAILRVWSARGGTNRIAVHPLQHTQQHEDHAFSILSGLEPVFLTTEPRQPSAADVKAATGPLGAVVIELPMQELGYVLPAWSEYVDLSDAARDRGVPLHVDGARIWESQHHFARPLPEIAALASSIYVSMYKGLGGLSGAVVASDREAIEEARVWRTRYGGNLFRQFPTVIAALDGLDSKLDRMADLVHHAAVVAETLAQLPQLTVSPNPPHINQFFIYAHLPADALNQAVVEHLESTGDRWLHGWWTDSDGRTVGEANIQDAGLEWTAANVVDTGRAVLAAASRIAGD